MQQEQAAKAKQNVDERAQKVLRHATQMTQNQFDEHVYRQQKKKEALQRVQEEINLQNRKTKEIRERRKKREEERQRAQQYIQEAPLPEPVFADRRASKDNFEMRSGGIRMEINLDMPDVVNRVVESQEEPQPRQIVYNNTDVFSNQNQINEAMHLQMEA